mgnify:FL=1
MNPQFTNASVNDFSLLSNSPAINTANPLFAPSDDYFSVTRDANPDIGAIEYVMPLSENVNKKNTFTIYPNPTSNFLTIEFADEMPKTILIQDVLGKKVFERNVTNDTGLRLDVTHLSHGVYYLSVDNQVFKLLKK